MSKIKASELLLQSAEPFDKACMLVREMEVEMSRLSQENAELRAQLFEANKRITKEHA